jgi:hypothetical protein
VLDCEVDCEVWPDDCPIINQPNQARQPEMLVPDADRSSQNSHLQLTRSPSGTSTRKDNVYVEIIRQQAEPEEPPLGIAELSQSESEEEDELALGISSMKAASPAGCGIGLEAAEGAIPDVDAGSMMTFEDDQEEGKRDEEFLRSEALERDNEDDDDDEEEDGDEDDDEDDDEDEEEDADEDEVDNDSSFAVSNISISTVSSVPSTPVKRAAKPKTSNYSRMSTAPRTPAKAPQSPTVVSTQPSSSRAVVKSPQKPVDRTPLGESRWQSHIGSMPSQDALTKKPTEDVASDATPEQQVQASAVKKKR